jgi:hypothetical protein
VRIWVLVYLLLGLCFLPVALVCGGKKSSFILWYKDPLDLWTEPLSEHTHLDLHLLWLLSYLQGKLVVPGMYLTYLLQI